VQQFLSAILWLQLPEAKFHLTLVTALVVAIYIQLGFISLHTQVKPWISLQNLQLLKITKVLQDLLMVVSCLSPLMRR
jgi:hypothetical protein